MTPLEVLKCTQELLANPDRWIQGAMAQAKDNQPVNFAHPRACRFSLEGALFRVCYITRSSMAEAHELLKVCIHSKGLTSLSTYNDAKGTSWLAVQELLNKAIQRLGGQARSFIPQEEDN